MLGNVIDEDPDTTASVLARLRVDKPGSVRLLAQSHRLGIRVGVPDDDPNSRVRDGRGDAGGHSLGRWQAAGQPTARVSDEHGAEVRADTDEHDEPRDSRAPEEQVRAWWLRSSSRILCGRPRPGQKKGRQHREHENG